MHTTEQTSTQVTALNARTVRSQEGLHFKVFSCLWAFATLFHMAQSDSFNSMLHYALLTLAAVHVIFRPSSVLGFVVLLSLQLHDVFFKLPAVSNHWIFTTFVDLTMLQALLYLILKKKTFQVDAGEWLETFAPVVRIEVIILYFYVVFHKLNSGFFSTDVSCASYFVNAQVNGAAFSVPPLLLSLGAYATIFIETLIPLLLCFRAIRNWGVLIGLLFHGMLGFNPLNGFYDFSSMIFAVYFLFAGPQVVRNIPMLWDEFKAKKPFAQVNLSKFSYTRLVVAIGVLLVALSAVNVLTKVMHNHKLYFFWLGYSLLVVLLFIRSMVAGRNKRVSERRHFFSLPHWSFFLLPLLVFFNGLSPYIGLKTEASFAMFSNLRTENGETNHYIMPASLQVFDYQQDMVEVVSSSDRFMQKLARTQQLMNYYKFRDYVGRRRPASLEYIYKGKVYTFRAAEAKPDNALLQANPYWFRKLMHFREISKSAQEPCGH